MRSLVERRNKDLEDTHLESINALRVTTMAVIVLGSTFFRTLKGALQNMEVLQTWVQDFSFSFVLSADFAIDCFFFFSSFLATFFLLKRMKENEGNVGSVLAIYLHRYMRLIPLYFFLLLFFWKFMVLFGDGPMFFLYDEFAQCGSRWYWHLFFLNNIIPWSSDDNCMGWTWYLANDFQFFLLVPLLAILYYRKRKACYITIGSLASVCLIIQISVILIDDLSASYFNYNNLYWTTYYVKPYARLPAFLIGLLFGFMHYSQRYEHPEQSKLASLAKRFEYSKFFLIVISISGMLLIFIVVILFLGINKAQDNIPKFWDMLFIITSRPLFVMGFAMTNYPVILGVSPLSTMASHDFWIPFSKLTYGVFLCHSVFILFREYNVERGQWGSLFDTTLFFLAYLFLSYGFSLLTFLFVEQPFRKLELEFLWKNRSTRPKVKNLKDVKEGLVADQDAARKGSGDTEDLEDQVTRERSSLIHDGEGGYNPRINA